MQEYFMKFPVPWKCVDFCRKFVQRVILTRPVTQPWDECHSSSAADKVQSFLSISWTFHTACFGRAVSFNGGNPNIGWQSQGSKFYPAPRIVSILPSHFMCTWGSICGSWCHTIPIADLTDVTLADEDTNSILTDVANRTIPGNMAMQVAPPAGQI